MLKVKALASALHAHGCIWMHKHLSQLWMHMDAKPRLKVRSHQTLLPGNFSLGLSHDLELLLRSPWIVHVP